MVSSTVFSKSVLNTKKGNKFQLLFRFAKNIIINNFRLFLSCSLLAIITAIINFNVGSAFKDAFFTDEKTLSTQTIDFIKKEVEDDKSIEIPKIEEIVKTQADLNEETQKKVKDEITKKLKEKTNQKSLKKKEAIELIEEASKNIFTTNIFRTNGFKFKFNLFGWKLFKRDDLGIYEFIGRVLFLFLIAKAAFSFLHYYLMSYSYELIECELKKDLFRHFIRAKYPNSSEVSQNLITQFASDLDSIAYSIWFIPNRLIYVFTSIFYLVCFEFNFGNKGINWEFVAIIFGLFLFLMGVEVILFRKASKLSIAAKKRYEKDNKIIYERINNLEYIKAVSGEKCERKKVGQQLDSTFQKNRKAVLYNVLFKAFPNYVIIPNIPTFFVTLAITFTTKEKTTDSAFLMTNFYRYYLTVKNLNNEVNKLIDSLLTLEELSSNLIIVKENVKILNKPNRVNFSPLPIKKIPFEKGDIVFKNVVFAYPKRPQQDILKNFSFCFRQGKSYGIAGKNGIGKSTITKTTLKLYEIKEGEILINYHNIQAIKTASLHRRICHQTNRPAFFRMSIAENVFYPKQYHPNDEWKLVQAAQQVGIYEFIEKLPKKFATKLRKGGSDLSEGQKQQIKAMQMFVHDYDIYILDEILSNVHPNLREIVLQNIFKQIKGKTVLVIDHHYEVFKHVNYVYQFTGEKLIKITKKELVN